MHVQNLIVGCGLAGATLACKLANHGQKALVIDKKAHIGGTVFDYKDENTNITVHRYGPHIFHTNDEAVWHFLSKYTKWTPFTHSVNALIDGKEVNLPCNINSLYKLFTKDVAHNFEKVLVQKFGYGTKIPIWELRKSKDNDLQSLADYLYEKIFKGYSLKQWGKNTRLDSSVFSRLPLFISHDDRFFQDKYQGIPSEGYTNLIKKLINHDNIEVLLNTPFNSVKGGIVYDKLFYSGSIDEFFDYETGHLPYRSINFRFKTFNIDYYQSVPQMNYPENFDFSRSIEHKYFLREEASDTVVSFEHPENFISGKNERLYPIPNDKNHKIYDMYLSRSKQLSNIFFFGRLGDYKYYNMDQVVARTLKLAEEIIQNGK